ncbi:MAG TPA: glycosyltransferase family 2 protein [bacterium]|nr:glycosyltransferase family 2 protein [bacterium]HPT29715.1 glycosyltransferase family 2 protein [bacterium]
MDLSIIIVNYLSRAKTISCLDAILASDLTDLKWEIVLVDNNSGDDLDDLAVKYPNLKLIYSQKNWGMGGGNNLGIKNSRGKYLLILNPDTRVKPDAIKILFNYLENHSDVLIAGPKLLNTDGSLQYSCARFPRFYTPILRRTFLGEYFKSSRDGFLMIGQPHDQIMPVDWLMGSCLIIRRDGFEGFDERYFMYFEDIDLCRRARRAGKQVVYVPSAVVIHDHARESATRPWYIGPFRDKLVRQHIRSWFKYFWKWLPFNPQKKVTNNFFKKYE